MLAEVVSEPICSDHMLALFPRGAQLLTDLRTVKSEPARFIGKDDAHAQTTKKRLLAHQLDKFQFIVSQTWTFRWNGDMLQFAMESKARGASSSNSQLRPLDASIKTGWMQTSCLR